MFTESRLNKTLQSSSDKNIYVKTKGLKYIMLQIVIATILFGILAASSIVLTGDRALISGDIIGKNILKMLLDWRFILSMALAVGSRFTFIYLNSAVLKIPALAKNSTTITSFITAFGYIFIILANYFFLKERLTPQQIIGASLIMSGIFLMVK
jgi:drug/metabolite transporter (DMT)-like permease